MVRRTPRNTPGRKNSTNHRVMKYLLTYSGGIAQKIQFHIIQYRRHGDKILSGVQAYLIIFLSLEYVLLLYHEALS